MRPIPLAAGCRAGGAVDRRVVVTEIDRVFAHWRALRDGTGEMHRDAWCHRAGERQSMRRVTLDVARAAGLRRCPVCWREEA